MQSNTRALSQAGPLFPSLFPDLGGEHWFLGWFPDLGSGRLFLGSFPDIRQGPAVPELVPGY